MLDARRVLSLRSPAPVILGVMVSEGTDKQPPRRRRRVYMTAGLTASAAVLAMSVQAAAQADDDTPTSSYGDTLAPEPDAED